MLGGSIRGGILRRRSWWEPYWAGWLDWMRAQGWRRFGLYAWDQGPGLPGDWNGRLAPAFELVFHFNREPRRPNKIIPCRWAGHVNSEKGGLRAKDGTVGEWQHAGQGVQETRIPDSVLRITRHKARGIETEHPAVFPIALPEFLMRAYADEGDVVFEPFAGAGTSIIAGQRTGRHVRAVELAPAYVDLAIARWRMLHPDLPVTLADDGRDYDAVAAARMEVGGQARNTSGALPVLVATGLSANPTAVTTGRGIDLLATLIGALVNKPFSIPEADWQYAGAAGGITGTADVVLKAAAAAGVRNYVTSIDLRNAHATVATEVVIKDGATVIWRQLLPAAMATPVDITFPTPLRGTAATAVNFACLTTGAQVYVNAQGYAAP